MAILGVSQSHSLVLGVARSVTILDHLWSESLADGRTTEATHLPCPMGLCVGGHSGGQTIGKLKPLPILWNTSLVSEDGRDWDSSAGGLWGGLIHVTEPASTSVLQTFHSLGY